MKVQFASPIKNRFGDDVKEPDQRNPQQLKTVTLADVCCAVLDAQFPGDERADAKEKVRRWELILAITKAERDLTPYDLIESDVDMIKGRLFKSSLPASVCGSANQLLSEPAVEMRERKHKAES